MRLKISILGANSHIAKGLIENFLIADKYILYLYSQNIDKTKNFVQSLTNFNQDNIHFFGGYRDFEKHNYDVIINCVGVGTINKLNGEYWKWFTVTEEFDNKIINYLRQISKKSLYISFSSGAIYGSNFITEINENTSNLIDVNHLKFQNYYSIARLNAEAKHRSFSNLNIVDLRLFSYFSRYLDLSDNYFLADIINSIKNNENLITQENNIVRDYVAPTDLFNLIEKIIYQKTINDFFDVYSKKSVSKNEVLSYFSEAYNLKYIIEKSASGKSGTGEKNIYCSQFYKAEKIGYKPKYTSLEVIKNEAKYLING